MLKLQDPGFGTRRYSDDAYLQTKYALKGYNVEATALEAAGGKVVTTGKDILVTLPAYRFTSTPETDNTWPIEVTAEDVKGNLFES
ncbi:adhesin [Escherichia coli]|nr:adhesin [Escherichia coli]VED47203.1 adhesin [Escherichia coli]